MSDWMSDTREIMGVKIRNGEKHEFHLFSGSRFERFERHGEYCMVPWIRITTPILKTIEVPANAVEWIELR